MLNAMTETYSTVRKGTKENQEYTNGDYYCKQVKVHYLDVSAFQMLTFHQIPTIVKLSNTMPKYFQLG